ncbi:HlyD family secretion protein [Flavobacterium terrae]|uniref:HlyD family secretion protein n=1 Tax=Flavobacterium terrae TaxID=415425 RepID=A0A1M6AE00_9FLAO|nr:HlyD family efflux transporter periplasmic adaptor subunit [Flavobacterium terrae]SHI34766.1 HlyD family secretion protein [Flavobacterium terrae]
MTEKNIFPEEILKSTIENHIVKHNKKTSVFFWVTCVALLIVFVSLPFITIDIFTTSRGTIVSQEKKVTIYVPSNGKITTFNIEENKKVKRGDTLLIISHEILKERENLNSLQSRENNLFASDLKNLIAQNYNAVKSEQYQKEYLKFKQELYNLDVILQNLQTEFNRKEHLFKKDVISKVEYERAQLEFDKVKNDRNNVIKQAQLTWQKELTQIQQTNTTIKSSQKQLKEEEENYIITAPIDGELVNMQGYHKGSLVAVGNAIIEISPDKNVVVETYINPSDIGFIMEKGNALYQIDAFNSNQWGFGTGKILEISKDVVFLNNTPFYKVRSSLDKDKLTLKNGAIGKLKKGMTLTSRFFLTRRTAFQLLFDEVEDWFNPYTAKK